MARDAADAEQTTAISRLRAALVVVDLIIPAAVLFSTIRFAVGPDRPLVAIGSLPVGILIVVAAAVLPPAEGFWAARNRRWLIAFLGAAGVGLMVLAYVQRAPGAALLSYLVVATSGVLLLGRFAAEAKDRDWTEALPHWRHATLLTAGFAVLGMVAAIAAELWIRLGDPEVLRPGANGLAFIGWDGVRYQAGVATWPVALVGLAAITCSLLALIETVRALVSSHRTLAEQRGEPVGAALLTI